MSKYIAYYEEKQHLDWLPFKHMSNKYICQTSIEPKKTHCKICGDYFHNSLRYIQLSTCITSKLDKFLPYKNIKYCCIVCLIKMLKLWIDNKHVVKKRGIKKTKKLNLPLKTRILLKDLYENFKYYRTTEELNKIYKTVLELRKKRLIQAKKAIYLAFLKHKFSTEETVSKLSKHFYSIGKTYFIQ